MKNLFLFDWPIKHAVEGAMNAGVSEETLVLLLLLPVVATFIASTRQILGIRGFGIFLPAALAMVFVTIGPLLGVSLFILIVFISTVVRLVTRKLKLKLQYLPRMALILWFVSIGVLATLFIAPLINYQGLLNVSVFPIIILTLLVEDFIRIQIGKSLKTAFTLTFQTLILSFVAYLFLTNKTVNVYTLNNPEIVLVSAFIINILLGRYVGLRLLEYLRFRKLINQK